jgi:hypothetical protein
LVRGANRLTVFGGATTDDVVAVDNNSGVGGTIGTAADVATITGDDDEENGIIGFDTANNATDGVANTEVAIVVGRRDGDDGMVAVVIGDDDGTVDVIVEDDDKDVVDGVTVTLGNAEANRALILTACEADIFDCCIASRLAASTFFFSSSCNARF